MTVEDVGREGSRLVSRLADAAVVIPAAAGYVALGAAGLVGRSLLDMACQMWGRLPSLGGDQQRRKPKRRKPKAA